MNLMGPIRPIALALCALAIAGCETTSETTSTHQFAAPRSTWRTKAGQLAYKGPTMAVIGEVLVRFSKKGQFELTLTKGPGVNLLIVRQDAQFASAEGPLAGASWAGPTSSAPERLRGWFSLRKKILAGGNSIQTASGSESFNLRF